MNDSISAEEFFEAVAYAKKLNPDDVSGLGSMKIDYENPKAVNNGVTYYKVLVLKKKGDKWDYIPLKFKFLKLSSMSRVLKPDDEKRLYPGIKIQFAHDSVYTVKKDGKDVEQHYGAAKIMAVNIWRQLLKNAIKTGKINNDNPKISGPVQTDYMKDKTKKIKEKLDRPILRLDIPLRNPKEENEDDDDKKKKKNVKLSKKDNELKPTAKPICDIYDQTKVINISDSRYKKDGFNYEKLMFDNNGVLEELSYENLGNVLVPGSIVSGVDNMSMMSTSNMGYSLSSKAAFLIVKPGDRSRINPAKIFDSDELEALNDDIVTTKISTAPQSTSKQEVNEDEEMFDNLDD